MHDTHYTPQEDQLILQQAGVLSFAKIGQRLGRTRHQVRSRWRCLCHNKAPVANPQQPILKLRQEMGQDTATLEGLTTIKDLQTLLQVAKVDLEIWEVEKHVINKWEGFASIRSQEVEKNDWQKSLKKVELWQVKVWLRKKTLDQKANQELRRQLIADLDDHSPRYPRIVRRVGAGEKILAEINVDDQHIGKYSWAPETGENYDLKIARRRYLDAVHDLLGRLAGYRVERILLPVGNDLLHTDNDQNTTNAGTPQDVDGRWQKAFLETKRMVVQSIDDCLQVAPVQVVMIPGNHDRQRIFYLGDSLESWYRRVSEVQVDNRPCARKYVEYGQVLLGFTHGSDEKEKELPLLMAVEEPQSFARTRWREWHTGHWHKTRETRYTAGDTHKGIVVRVLPSLCSTDEWHYRNGFVKNNKGSEMFLWSPTRGYLGHFFHSPKN